MSHTRIDSSTNRTLDMLGHSTHVLGEGEHAETSALIPNHQQVLKKQTHLGEATTELAIELALDRLFEQVMEHPPVAALATAGAIVSPLYTGYGLLKNCHEDWQRGQDAKGAAFNDACSFAVSSALDFPDGFKIQDHARRPGVEKAGMKLTEALLARPNDVRAMQRSADAGFLDAQRAWEAVKGLPADQRASAMFSQLALGGKADKLQGDLAYGKGVEYFLYTQQHPESAAQEAAKVQSRSASALDHRPPVRG